MLSAVSLSALVKLHRTLRTLTLRSCDELPPAAIAAWHGVPPPSTNHRLRSHTAPPNNYNNRGVHDSGEDRASESCPELPKLALESLWLGFRVNSDEYMTTKHVQSVEDLLLMPTPTKFGRPVHWVETCKMPTLQYLDLQKCKLSEATIKGLLFSGCYTQLKGLNIANALWPRTYRLTPAGASEQGPTRRLEKLKCDKCNFFEEDLLWLMTQSPSLTCLSTSGIPIGMVECFNCLYGSPSLTSLRYLAVTISLLPSHCVYQ